MYADVNIFSQQLFRDALMRIDPYQMDFFLHPMIDPVCGKVMLPYHCCICTFDYVSPYKSLQIHSYLDTNILVKCVYIYVCMYVCM